MVCHDILVAPMFADVAVLMGGGRVVAAGAAAAVLTEGNIAAVFGERAQVAWSGDTSVQVTFT